MPLLIATAAAAATVLMICAGIGCFMYMKVRQWSGGV